MGRRAKYATLTKYQPYIDIIRKDLGIPERLYVKFTFGKYTYHGGDSILYGELYGEVRVDKRGIHQDTLKALMHEYRHIWQFYTGKLKHVKGRTWLWNGQKHRDASIRYEYDDYMKLPWEIDARLYEQQITRLFPNYGLPIITRRILIAETKTMKLYRIRE